MAQYGRPISDIALGSWTTAPLWSKLDEVTADDADYIGTSVNNTICKLGLTSLTDPVSSSNHIIRYRHTKSGAGTSTTTIDLYQGTTLIASQAVADTTSWVTSVYTLSAAEADAITDYSALRIWFTASVAFANGRVSWCVFECPDVSGTTITIPFTPNASGTTINPAAPNAQIVLGDVPNASGISITPTGIGVISIVTIPNTPNASGTTINPTSAGPTVPPTPLMQDIPLVGTFITNIDLVGTFIIDTALSGTFDTTESLDGSI